MRRPVVLAAAVIGAGLMVASVYLFGGGRDSVEVSTAKVQRTPALQSLVTASGEIVAARYADIGANMMGRLVSLAVAEGDRVHAGQVLARIDPVQAASTAEAAAASLGALQADARAAATQQRTAQATLEEMRSRAIEAGNALTRAKQLRDSGLMPAADFDRAEAAAAAAEAQVRSAVAAVEKSQQTLDAAQRRVAQGRAEGARATDQLLKTSITAPIDGVVTRLDVEVGEMVVIGVQNQPGTILMTISDLSSINAEVKVAEADVMRLSVGLPAHITLEAVPDRRLSGRVVEIGASALPQLGAQASAREFRVKVRLDAADLSLRPGLTCDTEIVAAERRDALTVPLQSVVERNGTRGVFAINNDKAVFTSVKTGIIGGLSIEVDGIADGVEIVSGPVQLLRSLADGASVRRAARK